MPPPPRSHGRADAPTHGRAGRERAHQTCTTGYMCVCICVYKLCVRMYAYVCAHAQNASQLGRRRVRVRVHTERRAARDGDLHLGITVHMYIIICTRARMNTCMRALVECISARVGVGAGVRARRERASTYCVSLRTIYIDVYLYVNVGMYGCIIVCLYMCPCVCIIYIDIYRYILQRYLHFLYIYLYVCICMYVYTYI